MKNPKVQCVIVAVLLMVAGLLLIPSLTQAKPKGVPAWQADEPQQDGYSRSFVVDANSVLFTVPQGRCYVLTRLYIRTIDNHPPSWRDVADPQHHERERPLWTLTIDGEMFLDEICITVPYIFTTNGGVIVTNGELQEDFPDKQVVVHGGQTLGITKHEAIDKVCLTLIGYFCDAQ